MAFLVTHIDFKGDDDEPGESVYTHDYNHATGFLRAKLQEVIDKTIEEEEMSNFENEAIKKMEDAIASNVLQFKVAYADHMFYFKRYASDDDFLAAVIRNIDQRSFALELHSNP